MPLSDDPVAMISGGTRGLGLVVAETFLKAGYRVVLVGRDQGRVDSATEDLQRQTGLKGKVIGQVADVSDPEQVTELFGRVGSGEARLDVLVNCVGKSDRGLAESLSGETLDELMRMNVHTALLCSQAALPLLEKSGGVIVNVGSLASKVGARYIGGYAAAKHALAGITQQMRLECRPRGVHVALVSPGPIRRQDAGSRYESKMDDSLPAQAAAPGGGTTIKGLEPQRVADAILTAVRRRRPDLILPARMRILIAIGHAFPRLGDWLLLRFTSSKSE